MDRQNSNNIIVTGATGAIGKAICSQLLENQDVYIWALGRDRHKGNMLLDDIAKSGFEGRLEFISVDLGSKAAIEKFASKFEAPLDVLINNAAAAPKTRKLSVEGVEVQWATNVLGYFWLLEFLSGKFRKDKTGRVVNVSSYWAGDLDLGDVEFKQRPYDNNTAYRQSKQAGRMLTVAQAEQYRGRLCINACHPGDVASKLSFDLGYGGSQTAEQGARTPVWLALEETGGMESGAYFAHRKKAGCEFSRDKASIRSLWDICQSY